MKLIFPVRPCAQRAEIKKKFDEKYGVKFIGLIMKFSVPERTDPYTVIDQLIAASTYCGVEFYGFQLYYIVLTRGEFEDVDFLSDIVISLTEKPGRADLDAAFKLCNELREPTKSPADCKAELHDILNSKEKACTDSDDCGDFVNVFKSVLETMERQETEVNKEEANKLAKSIFEGRKKLEDKRHNLDAAIFTNSFLQVAEICTQYLEVDNKKEMTCMLAEKMQYKGPLIYNPMINRMRDKINFHASQIIKYSEKWDVYWTHRVGSIVVEYTQHGNDLKLLDEACANLSKDKIGLEAILANQGDRLDYKFIIDFLKNTKTNTDHSKDGESVPNQANNDKKEQVPASNEGNKEQKPGNP